MTDAKTGCAGCQHHEIKFNNGNGATICNLNNRRIVATGFSAPSVRPDACPLPKPAPRRSFVHGSQAWYFRHDVVDYVSIIVGSEGGGCDYELKIEWQTMSETVAPVVKVYDDAWRAFTELADVFAWLATMHDAAPTAEHVCSRLLSMGFDDETERTEP